MGYQRRVHGDTLTTEHSNNHKYIFFLYFILSASLFSFLVTLFKD